MGTQESIAYGVPMIGIPLYGDQRKNIMSYVRKNIAVMLPESQVTEKTLTEAVKTILNNPVYK